MSPVHVLSSSACKYYAGIKECIGDFPLIEKKPVES